jgi:hypothetical protein
MVYGTAGATALDYQVTIVSGTKVVNLGFIFSVSLLKELRIGPMANKEKCNQRQTQG